MVGCIWGAVWRPPHKQCGSGLRTCKEPRCLPDKKNPSAALLGQSFKTGLGVRTQGRAPCPGRTAAARRSCCRARTAGPSAQHRWECSGRRRPPRPPAWGACQNLRRRVPSRSPPLPTPVARLTWSPVQATQRQPGLWGNQNPRMIARSPALPRQLLAWCQRLFRQSQFNRRPIYRRSLEGSTKNWGLPGSLTPIFWIDM